MLGSVVRTFEQSGKDAKLSQQQPKKERLQRKKFIIGAASKQFKTPQSESGSTSYIFWQGSTLSISV